MLGDLDENARLVQEFGIESRVLGEVVHLEELVDSVASDLTIEGDAIAWKDLNDLVAHQRRLASVGSDQELIEGKGIPGLIDLAYDNLCIGRVFGESVLEELNHRFSRRDRTFIEQEEAGAMNRL